MPFVREERSRSFGHNDATFLRRSSFSAQNENDFMSTSNDSNSSTFPTDLQDNKFLFGEQEEEQPKQCNEALRFDESMNVYHDDNTWMTQEEKKDICWYSREELSVMKKARIEAAKRMLYANIITTFSKQSIRSLYRSSGSWDEKAAQDLGDMERSRMIRCYAESPDMVGMESSMLGHTKNPRTYHRRAILTAIAMLEIESMPSSPSSDDDLYEQEEIIRKRSESITFQSRIFARHIAMAQAAALLEESNSNIKKDEGNQSVVVPDIRYPGFLLSSRMSSSSRPFRTQPMRQA